VDLLGGRGGDQVIVDRTNLVDQWRARLVTHLDFSAKQVGQVGGGRNKPTGIVDVAMAQSLARRDDLPELTAGLRPRLTTNRPDQRAYGHKCGMMMAWHEFG
jgi:superfamily II DNA or RNA helicase